MPAASPNAVTAVKHAEAAPIWNCMSVSPAMAAAKDSKRQDGQSCQACGGHLSPPGAACKGGRQHAVGRQGGPEPAGAGHEGVDGAERQHRGRDRGERGRQ